MKYLKTKWKILSALETPLQADSVFGHICWALVYLEGEEMLKNFLEIYANQPPLLVSDGMPENKLPVPLLPPPLLDEKFDLKKAVEHKKSLKFKWLPEKALKEKRNNINSTVLSELLKADYAKGTNANLFAKEIISHNSIDRLTDRARKPGGFYQEETIFYKQGMVFDVYFAIDETVISVEILKKIFTYIEQTGYGRNKSTGRGQFQITIDDENHHGFRSNLTGCNAVMALSSFCPSQSDSAEGFYDITVKFGRLGGDYAKKGIPFKKAVTMLKQGSVFKVDNGNVPAYCGQLLHGVHERYEEICHYAYAMAYPFTLTEEAKPCLI